MSALPSLKLLHLPLIIGLLAIGLPITPAASQTEILEPSAAPFADRFQATGNLQVARRSTRALKKFKERVKRTPLNNGQWLNRKGTRGGERGNDYWHSDSKAVRRITNGKPIHYNNGIPDFSKWARGKVQFHFSGNRSQDTRTADALFARQKGWVDRSNQPDIGRAKQYRKEQGLVWHHHADCRTMSLVPAAIHGKAIHRGGVSEC